MPYRNAIPFDIDISFAAQREVRRDARTHGTKALLPRRI
jgi:hypothetical protein